MNVTLAVFKLEMLSLRYYLVVRYVKKQEALNWVAKTTECLKERGAMIRFVVQGRYVLYKENYLYNLVRRVEIDRLPVGSDNWGK